MQTKKLILLLICFLLPLLCSSFLFAGTTGKIAGKVTDKETGEPLPGANVVIVGTSLGAATDMDGNYTILQLPPGIYELSASVIGYSKYNVGSVPVRIDQTTTIDISLQIQTIEGEEITVVAELPTVRPDVSNSVASMSTDEVLDLPASDIGAAVRLQAGVSGDYQIRGGSIDEALLLVDGVTLRDPRNNQPISGVARSAVQEISVERGGFNAEYGQARSGIVNVVTKEGQRKYQGTLIMKYSPPAAKYSGISPFDPNSMWFRPYLDDDVCWTGTQNGAWDKYTQRQYPKFDGWNEISRRTLENDDPTDDLTPAGAQQVFLWEMRKKEVTNQPDYNIDAGFGGPVPFIGKQLGNLRFYASYRRYREMLIVPLTRDDYLEHDGAIRLFADISPSMKLNMSFMTGKNYLHAQNWTQSAYMRTSEDIAYQIGEREDTMFSNAHFSLTDISYNTFSAKLTHTVSANTFYEASLEHIQRKYYTRQPEARDTKTEYEIVPGYYATEAPFGYSYLLENGVAGMFFGGHTAKQRDNTVVYATTLKGAIVSQVNHFNQIKAGIEFNYNNLDFDYGLVSSGKLDEYSNHVQMDVSPIRAAMYVQDKLETNGFTANIGVRLDYSNANSDWYSGSPFDKAYFSMSYDPESEYAMAKSDPQWQISPRIGIVHPITEKSKLTFNYGHFKQMPAYEQLFLIERSASNVMTSFGNPNLTLAKTVSYELGYDHELFDTYLLQLAGYYRDVSNEAAQTEYYSLANVSYYQTNSNNYQDTRGFELTLKKSIGRWWTFLANYTYEVTTSGQFGRPVIYENPSEQFQYDRQTTNFYQDRPIPQPFARAYVTINSPEGFGPKYMGFHPLEHIRFNFFADWREGGWETWNPGGLATVALNVQQKDYFGSNIIIGKTFKIPRGEIELFVEISNPFSYKVLSRAGFLNNDDRDQYYASLHLPENEYYSNIVGDDRIGDYRKDGVDYQPIEQRGVLSSENPGDEGVIYYETTTEIYKYWDTNIGDFVEVEKSKMDKVLEDKAYIDMPNQTFFHFLNPRDVFFCIRTTFDLN